MVFWPNGGFVQVIPYIYGKLHSFIEGIFCISLDFEKYWGVRDVARAEAIAERFLRIEQVVEKMLNLFERYEIHASWAIVGLLASENPADLYETNGSKSIGYANRAFSPYPITAERYGDVPFGILSAPKEIRAILDSPNQELASHTFAHYYTIEEGQTEHEFLEDLEAMNTLASSLGHHFTTIVFPRNQVNSGYLVHLANAGYRAYRGHRPGSSWSNAKYAKESRLKKARRYLDAYFPISGLKACSPADLKTNEGLINIPASRFLRPWSGIQWLEKRKVNRVCSEMSKAAKGGTIYHLWWHPHNFSACPDESLEQLEQILLHYRNLQQQYGFRSLNMHEIAAYAKG